MRESDPKKRRSICVWAAPYFTQIARHFFGQVTQALGKSMEYRIANLITGVVTASYLCMFILLGLIGFFVTIGSGNFKILLKSTTYIWFLWGTLYVLSLYLVGTLKEKSTRRRVISWSFSIVFHVSLLLYLAVALNAGFAVFVIGIPECIITILSCIGLVLSIRSCSNVYA